MPFCFFGVELHKESWKVSGLPQSLTVYNLSPLNRLESAGCHALRHASRPVGLGQVSASASRDAGPEMARSMLGGNMGCNGWKTQCTERAWMRGNLK